MRNCLALLNEALLVRYRSLRESMMPSAVVPRFVDD